MWSRWRESTRKSELQKWHALAGAGHNLPSQPPSSENLPEARRREVCCQKAGGGKDDVRPRSALPVF
jgi:hypothetical protein